MAVATRHIAVETPIYLRPSPSWRISRCQYMSFHVRIPQITALLVRPFDLASGGGELWGAKLRSPVEFVFVLSTRNTIHDTRGLIYDPYKRLCASARESSESSASDACFLQHIHGLVPCCRKKVQTCTDRHFVPQPSTSTSRRFSTWTRM